MSKFDKYYYPIALGFFGLGGLWYLHDKQIFLGGLWLILAVFNAELWYRVAKGKKE